MKTTCMTAKIARVSQECGAELYGAKSSAMSVARPSRWRSRRCAADPRRPSRAVIGQPEPLARPPARLEVAEGRGCRDQASDESIEPCCA
jgi:hypothetical protein